MSSSSSSSSYDMGLVSVASADPSSSPSSAAASAADVEFDRYIRISFLIAEVVVGSVGGLLVCAWLWRNCRRRSRINVIIMNVTATDLLVICFACVMQLVWELVDRNWMAGDFMCRVLKWGQSFSMMSSNYMLVMLSVDRHAAIRSPLKKPISVMKMASIGYGVAALLSLPQLGVFRQNFVTKEGMFFNKTVCEPIFRDLPPWHRQLYLVFISIVVFYVPIAVVAFCYIRIYVKLSQKTAETKAAAAAAVAAAASHADASRAVGRPGKVLLQSTRSSSLPKAKAKILKMTIVIVTTFIVCGLPYHVLEMFLSFGYHSLVTPVVMSVFGAMAVANSAVNPYVFLLFCGADDCLRCLKERRLPSGGADDSRRRRAESTIQTQSVQLAVTPGSSERYETSELGGTERTEIKQLDR